MLSFHLRAGHETIIAEGRNKKNERKFVGALAFISGGRKREMIPQRRAIVLFFPFIYITLTLDVVAICLLK